jgi:hypothetical protein
VTDDDDGQPPEWAGDDRDGHGDDRDGQGHRPGPGPRVLDGLPPVVVFSGSRRGWDETELRGLIGAKLAHMPDGTWIMHGGSGIVDLTAGREAAKRSLPVFSVPFIDGLGKRGGPERNTAMATAARSLMIAGHVVQVCAMWAGHGERCGHGKTGQAVDSCHCGTLHMAGMAGLFGLPTAIVMPGRDGSGPAVYRDGERPPDIPARMDA